MAFLLSSLSRFGVCEQSAGDLLCFWVHPVKALLSCFSSCPLGCLRAPQWNTQKGSGGRASLGQQHLEESSKSQGSVECTSYMTL